MYSARRSDYDVTNTVRVTVGTLRRKIQTDDEEPLIETVVGRGYRLLDEP